MSADKEYLKRYDPADEGLRFMPGVELNLSGLPPVPDGTLGDRTLREALRTHLFKGPITRDDVVNPTFTADEINDVIQYFPWNFWDQLVLRAQEGVSGLIPRQEYELMSFVNAWNRWPGFMRAMIEKAGGLDGIVDLAARNREPGSKINMLHCWSMGIVTLLGRAAYLILEDIEPGELSGDLNDAMKFWQAASFGYRGDGYVLGSQTNYLQRTLDDPWPQRFEDSLKSGDDEWMARYKGFMAEAELLAFYIHFDCRLGMMDMGPWILPNGNPMIVRNAFVKEDIYPWSAACDDLPYCMIFGLEIDADKAGLEELRCIDIGTLMTKPYDYVSAIARGSVWVRDEWDSEVREVDLDEAIAQWGPTIQDATLTIYETFARTPRRHLIEQGAFVYYLGMIYPFMRALGMYEEFDEEWRVWDFDRKAGDVYYKLDVDEFARVTVPTKLFDPKDSAFALVPPDTKFEERTTP